MKTLIKKSIITSFALVLTSVGVSNAQEFVNKEAPADVKTYGNWSTACEKSPKDPNVEACFTSQTMVLKDNNAEVLYIAVGRIPNIPEPVLAITTPLRTFLPAGIKITVDEENPQTLPHEFCDPAGCHLRVGVKQEVIDAMKGGKNLNIEFRDAVGQKLLIPVSLSGFTKAFDSLKKS